MTFPANPWTAPAASAAAETISNDSHTVKRKPRGPHQAVVIGSAGLPFDLSTLKVERGIDPGAAPVAGSSKWAPLFDMMSEVGESVAFPGEHKAAVAVAALLHAKRIGKKTFTVRRINATTARIFKVA
jgi:hypothetical protein